MANLFNAVEIIDMGIEKEKKRRDFYGLVAERFEDKEMKDLFSRLRDWEETHIKKFTEIKNSISESESETTDSYSGEFGAYMQNIIDEKLYKETTPAEFSSNIKTPLDAIQRGIWFEKDAILFFGELLAFMPPYHKDAVQKLIDEEKQHIIYLSQLREKFE